MLMSDERGFTLVELLIGMMVSMVVLAAILAMVQVATGDQNRVSQHVIANQRGRPVMNRILDRIHSACVSPGLAPVRAGSDENLMTLYSKSGSAVQFHPWQFTIIRPSTRSRGISRSRQRSRRLRTAHESRPRPKLRWSAMTA